MSDREEKPHTWPAHVVRQGQIEAAIWERRNPETGEVRHFVTLNRSYKTREGEWARTSTFDRKELGIAVRCAEKAQDWILARERERARENARSREPAAVRPAPQMAETRRQIQELISTLSRRKEQDVQKIVDSRGQERVEIARAPEAGRPRGREQGQPPHQARGKERPLNNDP